MKNFRISASIVTYNNEKEIRGVLDSLLESSVINKLDVFVVDNGSIDKTVKIVQENYSNIHLIKTEKNVGYGSGHNEAIRIVNSEYHFIINPDIKFDPKLIENIVGYFEKNRDAVLCIPNVFDEDNTLKYPPKKDPRIRYLLGRYFEFLGGVLKKWSDEYGCKDILLDRPVEIEFCSGSFMAARTDALKKVGGFDSRFFLYFEDADLSRRMRKHGKVVCNPYYSVQHEGKRESHKSFKGLKMMLSSMIKYFFKWGWKF